MVCRVPGAAHSLKGVGMDAQPQLNFERKPKSQCDHILDEMRAGRAVTPKSAFKLCGTLALHSRISELRNKRGLVVNMELVTENGKTFGSYTLPPEQRTQ
jgi:hypothetical protein